MNIIWRFSVNWLLITVLVILAAFTFIGMHRGIIKMIFSVVSLVGTLIAVFILLPIVTDSLKDNTKVYDVIQEIVEEKIVTEDMFEHKSESEVIDDLNFPAAIKEMLRDNNTAQKYVELGVTSLRGYMVKYVSDLIFNVLTFVISFLIVFILLRVIFGFVSVLAKLPVLNQINRAAGAAAGFVMGLAVIWLAFAVLTIFGSSVLSKSVFEAVNDSAVLTFIYDKNFIMKYVRIIMR